MTGLLLAIVLSSGAAGPPAPQGPPAGETRPDAPAAESDLAEEARRVISRVEGIRSARFATAPVVERGTTQVRAEAVRRRLDAAIPPERLEARGRAWADLGLGAAASPRELLEKLAWDLGTMVFSPADGKILVDPVTFPAEDFAPKEGEDEATALLLATGLRPDEPALAHELVHARQSERKSRRPDPLQGTTDAVLAASAWAEGEANLVAILFVFEGMGIGPEVLEHGLDPGAVLRGRLMPSSMDELSGVEQALVDFVYREGFAQTSALYWKGAWKAFDAASASRRTTRDVLHPDRTPSAPGEHPAPAVPAGFELADSDVLGEEGIIVLISLLTGKDNLGLIAADGWVGDDLYRWEPVPGRAGAGGFTSWVTRWTTPEKALDFEYGFVRALEARFPGGSILEEGGGKRRLETKDRVFRIRREGSEVRIRIAPPATDTAFESAGKPPTKQTERRKK